MGWSDFKDDFGPYIDFEWYATDAEGRVAFLTSAGFGPVPLAVFRSRPAYEAARAFFKRLITRGPVAKPSGGRLDCWTDAAQRGMYAYDWDAAQGCPLPRRPYRLQAAPTEPLLSNELPANVQTWLEEVRFAGLTFSTSTVLRPEEWFTAVEP